MVERVEHIQAELETEPFLNREVFLNTDVKVLIPGCTQIGEVSWSIPQAPRTGDRECRRVEPLGAARIGDVIVANHIDMLARSEIVQPVA